MKNLLIDPPMYLWEELGTGEYPIALLKLASYLKSIGEEVDYFDFIPYKYFRSQAFPSRDEDNFEVQNCDKDPDIVSCYKGHQGTNRRTLARRTGEHISRIGIIRHRYYVGVDKQVFVDYLKANKPDKIWVSSGLTYGWRGTKECIDICKDMYPDVQVVLGGIYPTLCLEHAKANTRADVIIEGECSEFKDYPMDFSILPNKPQYIIRQLTKGCPNKCKFCAVTYVDGPRVSFVDIDRDVREIKEFYDKYGCNRIKMWGSNLLIPGRGKTFERWLDGVISLGIKFEIVCPEGFAPELLTEGICRKIKEAGFLSIIIPLEEADSDHLTSGLGKRYGVDTWKAAVGKAISAGIEKEQIQVPIIIGTKGQTVENLEKAIDIYRETGVKPSVAKYTPVPKSQWYEEDPILKSIDLEHLQGALYPAIRDAKTYREMSKHIGILVNSSVLNYKKGLDESMENQKESQDTRNLISKLATIVLDISEQNEEIIKLLTKLVEGKNEGTK